MKSLKTKTLALENFVTPQPSSPAGDGAEGCGRLRVTVVFTTARATYSALSRAKELADGLGAQIRILAPQVVPYPLSLECPPVVPAFGLRDFRTRIESMGIETHIEVRLCRDRGVTLAQALAPRSLVVIGDRNRWRPTSESSLARKLRRAGHDVILVNQN